MPTISLCMIALNEEEWIGRALENTTPFVDEIIVVDGGSTDQTVSIAKQAGATVIHSPWDDHFAHQRNVSLNHATSDWILVMDPDETHEPGLLKQLRDLAQAAGSTYDMVGFPRKNLLDGVQTKAYPDFQWRFFPRTERIRFYGRLHERPLGWQRMLVLADAHIIHDKPSSRQEVQNQRYDQLKRQYGEEIEKWLRDLGDPATYEVSNG